MKEHQSPNDRKDVFFIFGLSKSSAPGGSDQTQDASYFERNLYVLLSRVKEVNLIKL